MSEVGWLSGLKRRLAKPLRVSRRAAGSNPAPTVDKRGVEARPEGPGGAPNAASAPAKIRPAVLRDHEALDAVAASMNGYACPLCGGEYWGVAVTVSACSWWGLEEMPLVPVTCDGCSHTLFFAERPMARRAASGASVVVSECEETP